MKKAFIWCMAVVAFSACNLPPSKYVNPFVGTDFHGHTTPAAIVPFGMIQPGPDTRLEGWDGCSGYHYSDDTIYGFSHTHLSGTGVEDYCDILLMPFANESEMMTDGKLNNLDYCSPFSHKNEKASPGYYRVLLDKDRLKVELTASERAAFHRYTYPYAGTKGFVVDLQHRDKVIDAGMHIGTDCITGWRRSNSWNPDQKIFFALKSNLAFSKVIYSADSTQAVVYLPEEKKEALITVSISAVDIDGAIKNMGEMWEDGTVDFEKKQGHATSLWNRELGKIMVSGMSLNDKRTFYSALYHCMTAPYLYSDVDGRYRGTDNQIHRTEARADGSMHNIYTVFSLWDTYRTLHPLLTIIDPQRTEDFIYTFLKQYEQGGELTMWELSSHETHCMIGYHSAPVILEAWNAGILDSWSSERKNKLIEGLVVTSNRTEAHRKYGKEGFLNSEYDNESVSKTLEYAYDDWCIAQCAKLMGNDSVYNIYIRRSQSWQNIMNEDGFMQARRNGGFVTPFEPTEINNHYTEANSWQYSTYVPHDIPQWVKYMGGKERASEFLDSLFFTTAKLSGREQSDVTGLVGQYAHGNEPSHAAAFLYTYLGKPERSDSLVRHILDNLYSAKPDGLCGNEDCGQMSAWYVMSAMGMYPVCPGSGEMVTTTPIFDKITLHLDSARTMTIEKSMWQSGKFIRQWRQGECFDGVFLDQSAVGLSDNERTTPTPIFGDWQQRFNGSATITLRCIDPSAAIYYTTDGSTPDTASTRYSGAFTIAEDAVVAAVAYTADKSFSPVVRHVKTAFYADKTLSYITTPDPQYYENGEEGLIDRLHGSSNYRIGGWQGWTGDMEVMIDLLEEKVIYGVGVECLENMRSWIFFPKSMEISVSTDGTNFTQVSGNAEWENVLKQYPAIRERQEESNVETFNLKFAGGTNARYVKVKVENYGAIPDWHVSSGEQAWLFVDEIMIY